MNTGIGDAINLAWKLADIVQQRASEEILASYEPERITFARALVETTDQVFRAVVSQGISGHLLRSWLVPLAAPLVTRIQPVRRWLFNTVSQIRIHYRHSPLSQGIAGQRRGGDRMPWVRFDGDDDSAWHTASDDGASKAVGDSHRAGREQKDNFAPLDLQSWRVQIYGAVAPELRAAAAELNLPLDEFPFTAATEQAGLTSGALYLLRPDAHIALASTSQNPLELRNYAARFGLRFG